MTPIPTTPTPIPTTTPIAPIPLAITGAAGRMGRRLVALAHADPALRVVAGLEAPGHPSLGQDVGALAGIGDIGVRVSAELTVPAQVLIDFTVPAATREFIKLCRQRKLAHLIGTTGLSPADHALIDAEAGEVPVLQSPTMALGVAVLYRLAAEAAKLLGPDYDIEIVEAHHRYKKDAPSGTALGLADAILAATGKTRDALRMERQGHDCPRQPGEITMQSLRMGDEVGMHTAYFAAVGERVELTHRSTSRDTFAVGALRAAKWLAGRKPGRYRLADVLRI
jgi:4-hydroxy-tetrahydrodipicolinate reductase